VASDRVLVIDLGAQYAQLIARRIREANVLSEIVPRDISASEVREADPIAVVLSGGPASVYDADAYQVDAEILELGVPVLGICYGHQLLAQYLGGEVTSTGTSEFGGTELRISGVSAVLDDADQLVWMSHRDSVSAAPAGFTVTARTEESPVAAMEDLERRMVGVQFHPEVSHTPKGSDMLRRFLFDVAGAQPTWTSSSIIEWAVAEVKDQVGEEQIICGLSGGVDSAVAAALVLKAVGEQLTCVFVDTGLLRRDEGSQVIETFERVFRARLIAVDAGDRFMRALAGVTDPERKRKTIGETFIRVFEEAATELADAKFLVQGTLYPDIIESGTSDAAKIKSHHNVGGLPDDMAFDLVEPLRGLFKDEVRAVGLSLGLPEEIVWRQPFPGPGLAVRIIGEVTAERCEILREADAIITDEIENAGLGQELWQWFGVLPAIKTVGVQGDERTYAHPLIVRAVQSEDAMTADWARLPYEVLDRISSRVINEVPSINRVAYDISSKPPATIEWE